jgi:hypothetical protein
MNEEGDKEKIYNLDPRSKKQKVSDPEYASATLFKTSTIVQEIMTLIIFTFQHWHRLYVNEEGDKENIYIYLNYSQYISVYSCFSFSFIESSPLEMIQSRLIDGGRGHALWQLRPNRLLNCRRICRVLFLLFLTVVVIHFLHSCVFSWCWRITGRLLLLQLLLACRIRSGGVSGSLDGTVAIAQVNYVPLVPNSLPAKSINF